MIRAAVHRFRRAWLRSAVLGANDGIVSIASLMIGVAAAHSVRGNVLLAGVAGTVAGAMSLAASEYVSVSSQADSRRADLAAERGRLEREPEAERRELAEIYRDRGLDAALADEVAAQLLARDALAAEARDKLGLSKRNVPRPLQGALAAALSFAAGAALPLIAVWVAPAESMARAVVVVSLLALAGTGASSARAGGASVRKGMARVTFWSALAMAVTAAVGSLFGVPG